MRFKETGIITYSYFRRFRRGRLIVTSCERKIKVVSSKRHKRNRRGGRFNRNSRNIGQKETKKFKPYHEMGSFYWDGEILRHADKDEWRVLSSKKLTITKIKK
jgi:hypothetical protein